MRERSHLAAAQSALSAGDFPRARQELERIREEVRLHTDVLEFVCVLEYEARGWNACFAAAMDLTGQDLGSQTGHIYFAKSTRQIQGPQAGVACLSSVIWDQFPTNAHMRVELAGFYSALNQLRLARDLINDAFGILRKREKEHPAIAQDIAAEARRLGQAMLRNEDFKPLWPEIQLP